MKREHSGDHATRLRGTPLVAWLAAALLRAFGATWRVRVEGRNALEDRDLEAAARLGALWHSSLIPAAWLFRDAGICVGVSRSRDGDLISATLERLGFASPGRGSSSRGGAAALRTLVRAARAGTSVAILADGPRGPARRAKPGIVALAQLCGSAITPIVFAARPAWRFASWDGTLLPLPFARVSCAFGEPIPVPRRLSRTQREALLARIEHELNALQDRVEQTAAGARAQRPPVP